MKIIIVLLNLFFLTLTSFAGWTKLNLPESLSDYRIRIDSLNNLYYFCTNGSYISTDFGYSWQKSANYDCTSLAFSNTNIFYSAAVHYYFNPNSIDRTDSIIVKKSIDAGKTNIVINTILGKTYETFSMSSCLIIPDHDNYFWLWYGFSAKWPYTQMRNGSLQYYQDSNLIFEYKLENIKNDYNFINTLISLHKGSDSMLFALEYYQGIMVSTNKGKDWPSLIKPKDHLYQTISDFTVSGTNKLIFSTQSMIYFTNDLGANWETVSLIGVDQFHNMNNGKILLAGGNVGQGNDAIYVSDENFQNFKRIRTLTPNSGCLLYVSNNDIIYADISNDGFYRYDDLSVLTDQFANNDTYDLSYSVLDKSFKLVVSDVQKGFYLTIYNYLGEILMKEIINKSTIGSENFIFKENFPDNSLYFFVLNIDGRLYNGKISYFKN